MSQGRKRLSFLALLNWRWEQQGSNGTATSFPRCCLHNHRGDERTKDDERQVLPDSSQPVQHERSYDAADIARGRAKGHSQVPTCKNTQIEVIETYLWWNSNIQYCIYSFYLTHVGKSSVLTKTTISTAMVTVNRPRLPTTVLNQNISEVQGCIRLDWVRLTCVP